MSSKTQLIPLVTTAIPDRKIKLVLDCGCGIGKWASILRCHKTNVQWSYFVGLDIFLSNLKFCKKYGAYDDLILGDAANLPFKEDSLDLIVAAEIIEHMEKKVGEDFLNNLERVCSGRIIITTPNMEWFDNPIHYEDGTENIYELHKSRWTINDFKKRGYRVRAIGIKWRPRHSWLQMIVAGLDFLFFPAWFLPQLGKHLVAFKGD